VQNTAPIRKNVCYPRQEVLRSVVLVGVWVRYHVLEPNISKTVCDKRLGSSGAPIGNGIWGMVTWSMTSRDPLRAGGVACAWRRFRSLTVFLVKLAAGRHLEFCRKSYSLTKVLPISKYLSTHLSHEAIFDSMGTFSTSMYVISQSVPEIVRKH